MYVHLSSPFLQAVSLHLFYLGRVPFFLVLAGYFLGRNITWNKAFNRAFWLFIPFMFWNVLYVFLVLPHDGASFRLENLIGIRDVFLPGMNLFSADDSHAVPPIGPSWFLRDIIILTLLTPLLVRVKILLFPAVLLFFCFFNTAPDHMETISIGTCAFYLLGVALSSRRIDDIHLVMNKKFGIFFWVSIFMPVVLIALYSVDLIPLWKETAIGMLLGVMMIMYAGIWMENSFIFGRSVMKSRRKSAGESGRLPFSGRRALQEEWKNSGKGFHFSASADSLNGCHLPRGRPDGNPYCQKRGMAVTFRRYEY